MHAHMARINPSAWQHPAIYAAQTPLSGLSGQRRPLRAVYAIHTAGSGNSTAAGVGIIYCRPHSTGANATACHRQLIQRTQVTLGFSRTICQTAACRGDMRSLPQQRQWQQLRAHIRCDQRPRSPAAATGRRQAWRRLRTTQHQSERPSHAVTSASISFCADATQ